MQSSSESLLSTHLLAQGFRFRTQAFQEGGLLQEAPVLGLHALELCAEALLSRLKQLSLSGSNCKLRIRPGCLVTENPSDAWCSYPQDAKCAHGILIFYLAAPRTW